MVALDLSAAVGDALSLTFAIALGYYAWKIGKYSEFVRFWKWIAVGWIIVAVGRGVLEYDHFNHVFNAFNELNLSDVGRVFVIVGTVTMLIGFKYLADTLHRAFDTKSDK